MTTSHSMGLLSVPTHPWTEKVPLMPGTRAAAAAK